MKALGLLAVFVLSAVGMWSSLHRRAKSDPMGLGQEVAGAVSNEKNWDEANRRPVKEVFFCEVPSWISGSKSTDSSPTPSMTAQPVSSGVQSNPFSD